MRQKKQNRGFTLIELMVTVGLVAILSVMAAPSFMGTVKNGRITSQINQFVAALIAARSEALKRSANITVCKTNNNTQCLTGGDWNQGWIVFIEGNGDNTIDAGEEVLLVHGPLEVGNTLKASVNAANRVTFNNRGFADGFNATFTLCDDRGAEKAKGLVLSNTGRLSRAVDLDGDGIEDGLSGDLVCP